jgi:hypothetical protein
MPKKIYFYNNGIFFDKEGGKKMSLNLQALEIGESYDSIKFNPDGTTERIRTTKTNTYFTESGLLIVESTAEVIASE